MPSTATIEQRRARVVRTATDWPRPLMERIAVAHHSRFEALYQRSVVRIVVVIVLVECCAREHLRISVTIHNPKL